MKIEENDINYNIFINKEYSKVLNYDDKDHLIEFVKNIIIKLKLKLVLNGFYKVKVYPHNKIGLFINIIKLDNSDYSNTLDLRIVINYDVDFYFKCEDFFIINNYENIRYYDNNYYLYIDNNFSDISKICEHGKFVYGEEVNKILKNSIIL